MKTFRLLALITLLTGGLFVCARADEIAAGERTLWVRVEAPFVSDLMYQGEVADALFWQVRQALSDRQGDDLQVEQIDTDASSQGAPVLNITLIRWRQTRMGDIECRFTADYITADGRQSLGVFEGITTSITRSRGFVSADFEKAAEQAGRRLGEALKKRNLP